jgi:hypothetical protein
MLSNEKLTDIIRFQHHYTTNAASYREVAFEFQ